MAVATNQGTATAAVAGAGVCAATVGRYCHLRCAPGICLILQCKISKVVERPGVHYRGRHSPWISSYRGGSFWTFFFTKRLELGGRTNRVGQFSPSSDLLETKRGKNSAQQAPFHLLCEISSPFFFISLVYHLSSLYSFIALLWLKMHYLLPIRKERFSISTTTTL